MRGIPSGWPATYRSLADLGIGRYHLPHMYVRLCAPKSVSGMILSEKKFQDQGLSHAVGVTYETWSFLEISANIPFFKTDKTDVFPKR